MYIDVPSLFISSSINSPIFLSSNSGFCLLRMNIDGDDVLSSSVKKNSLNLIVFPTRPVKIVSPIFGFKNLIFSFILYSAGLSFCDEFEVVVIPVFFFCS
jgi:hypothetical protein